MSVPLNSIAKNKLSIDRDGVDHINIHPTSNTRLGRMLSTFADIPVEHPIHGRFRTAEGFRAYLLTGLDKDEFRSMSGYECHKHLKSLNKVWYNDYEVDFEMGIRNKIVNKEELLRMFIESEQPFTMYIVSKKDDSMRLNHVNASMVVMLGNLRSELKE